MRTTIDIPEDLYTTLKVRASLRRASLREVIQQLIEKGLRSPTRDAQPGKHFDPPPVIIPPRGKPIPAMSGAKMRRIEEEEDEAKHKRSA